MQKRGMVFGSYNTAAHGWTLTGWQLSPAEQKTNFIDKNGGDGSWDLSTALTDGIPKYRDRTLTATFECSKGNRMHREELIREMVNLLDGMAERIELPDDELHYIHGRLHVAREYNDLAHGAVTVTAICEPWKYSNIETKVVLYAGAEAQTVQLVNSGRRAVIPIVKVEQDPHSTHVPNVNLTFGAASVAFWRGNYMWADLFLTPGTHELTYSGYGVITITYREAVLE